MQTLCFDGSSIHSFRKSNPAEEGGEYTSGCHVIIRPDMTSIKIDPTSDTCIIDSNTRAKVNHSGQKQTIGKDYDYLQQMFELRFEDRFAGIYTYLPFEEKIFTVDFEKTYFEVTGKGEFGVEFAPDEEDMD